MRNERKRSDGRSHTRRHSSKRHNLTRKHNTNAHTSSNTPEEPRKNRFCLSLILLSVLFVIFVGALVVVVTVVAKADDAATHDAAAAVAPSRAATTSTDSFFSTSTTSPNSPTTTTTAMAGDMNTSTQTNNTFTTSATPTLPPSAAASPRRRRILLLGDSLTEGMTTVPARGLFFHTYGVRLRELLPPSYALCVAGVSTNDVQRVLSRAQQLLQLPVGERPADALLFSGYYKPGYDVGKATWSPQQYWPAACDESRDYDYTVLLAGTNDLIVGAANVAERIVRLAEYCEQNTGGGATFVLTIPPYLREPHFEAARPAVNEALREAISSEKLIDLAAQSFVINDAATTYTADELHFTIAGYDRLANFIYRRLRETIPDI